MLKANHSSVALFFKIIQLKTYNYKTMNDVCLNIWRQIAMKSIFYCEMIKTVSESLI